MNACGGSGSSSSGGGCGGGGSGCSSGGSIRSSGTFCETVEIIMVYECMW